MIFGVNHIGHFLLTVLLLERLKKCGPSRVITVASEAHRFGNINFNCIDTHKDLRPGESLIGLLMVYSHSKLCNLLFTHELAKRLEGTDVTCYSVHSGLGTIHPAKTININLCPTMILKNESILADLLLGTVKTDIAHQSRG